MDIVDRDAGADLVLSYEGGLLTAARTDYDFMRIKRAAVGFRRTRGFFEGSLAEVGYGRNEMFGQAFAARRWSPRFRIQCRLVPTPGGEPKAPGAAERASGASLVHAFADLTVDTDNRSGPDAIRALFGLTLDSGAILRGIFFGGPE
jgi:hypothetical protein